jgi:ring-1,2-phenylacetyl-CoA epoxidase subunit PaaD
MVTPAQIRQPHIAGNSDPANAAARLELARAIAATVPDPEIPAINLDELGILRDVQLTGDTVVVTLTPTYTGCPATEAIRQDVRDALMAGGFEAVRVEIVLSPPWSTDWISETGRRKLREYGIAPPAAAGTVCDKPVVLRFVDRRGRPAASEADLPACPLCGSGDSEQLSEHGSTPCKALYRCRACREPFDYFKPY